MLLYYFIVLFYCKILLYYFIVLFDCIILLLYFIVFLLLCYFIVLFMVLFLLHISCITGTYNKALYVLHVYIDPQWQPMFYFFLVVPLKLKF